MSAKPLAEMHPSECVVLLSPWYTAHPKFHATRYVFVGDLRPGETPIPDRLGLDAELPWRSTAVLTACGILLDANAWMEDGNTHEVVAQREHHHASQRVDLRLDQAESFGTPCGSCWRDSAGLRSNG